MEKILICVLADAPIMALGASFDFCCEKCTRVVMVAPSGQRLLREHPETRVMCCQCFPALRGEKIVELAASPEEVLREMSSAVPNFRRHRN